MGERFSSVEHRVRCRGLPVQQRCDGGAVVGKAAAAQDGFERFVLAGKQTAHVEPELLHPLHGEALQQLRHLVGTVVNGYNE